MKKFRVIQALVVLFTALAFTSCGDEDLTLEPLGPNAGQADLRVNFDNETFVASAVTAAVANNAITITGSDALTGEMLTMTLNQTALTLSTPFTVPAVVTSYDNVSMSYMDAGTEYVNVNAEGESTGAIVITEVNTAAHTISGHFSFVGYDPDNASAQAIAFYSGSFTDVPYTGTLAEPLPPAPVNPGVLEYLRAKIDGAATATEFGLLAAMPASGNLNLTGGILDPLSSVSIIVDAEIAAGTYSFGPSPLEGVYGVYNTGGVAYTSTEGSLTVISNDGDIIKGTFNFTAADSEGNTKVLTAGEFNLVID